MIARIDIKEQVRISVSGAYPGAVNAPPRGDSILTDNETAKIYSFTAKNINNSFPGFRLRHGMLRFVSLYGELDFIGTTARGGTRSSGLILGKERRNEKKYGQ